MRRLSVAALALLFSCGIAWADIAVTPMSDAIPDPPYPGNDACGKAPKPLRVYFRMGQAVPWVGQAMPSGALMNAKDSFTAWHASSTRPDTIILIRGSSNRGEPSGGPDLAEARVQAVRAMLLDIGVAPTAIWTQTATEVDDASFLGFGVSGADISAVARSSDCERTLAADRFKWFLYRCSQTYPAGTEPLELFHMCFVAKEQLLGLDPSAGGSR